VADRAQIEAIEAGLASANLEDVHDAIIDIGKQGHRELVPRVVRYLTSQTAFLREAALLALVFHLRSSRANDRVVAIADGQRRRESPRAPGSSCAGRFCPALRLDVRERSTSRRCAQWRLR
jgi:hypothetical protein